MRSHKAIYKLHQGLTAFVPVCVRQGDARTGIALHRWTPSLLRVKNFDGVYEGSGGGGSVQDFQGHGEIRPRLRLEPSGFSQRQ